MAGNQPEWNRVQQVFVTCEEARHYYLIVMSHLLVPEAMLACLLPASQYGTF